MKSHFQYAKYLARHKWFVFVAGLRVGGIPIWRLIIHDWSKLLPCEWFAYVDYFYGERLRLLNEEPDDFRFWNAAQKYYDAFDRAWLHHQHANPHHWQHWVLRSDDGKLECLKMPDGIAREMVADWCGAGRAIAGKWEVWIWYDRMAAHIQMHDETRKLVESLIHVEQGELEVSAA